MTSVTLYDTTLRDGMQGEVMSLSAEERVRVVHALDKLGVQGKLGVCAAEQSFAGFRGDRGYGLPCLRAAADAGADGVTLCDTNGSSRPSEVRAATERVVAELGDAVEVGIHTHDDAGCGV